MELFSGLDWDVGNIEKCQTHGVSVAEIVELFEGEPKFAPDMSHSEAEQRFIATGRNGIGRALFIVFTVREHEGQRLVRPISARYMHAKEAARYGH